MCPQPSDRFEQFRLLAAALDVPGQPHLFRHREFVVTLLREHQERERLAAQTSRRVLLQDLGGGAWLVGDESAPTRLQLCGRGLAMRAAVAAIRAQQEHTPGPLVTAFSSCENPDQVVRKAVRSLRFMADQHCPSLARALRCMKVSGRPARLHYEPGHHAERFVFGSSPSQQLMRQQPSAHLHLTA